MQEELLQFKIHKVWVLVDLPYGKKAIGTKWVYRNKKDERGVVVRNKARLVAQGHRQEEGIDYDEVNVYVDDIHLWVYIDLRCDEFEALMKSKFQMSSMGELTFSWFYVKPDRRWLSLFVWISHSKDFPSPVLSREFLDHLATSTTEAEYVVAASCCGQVLWIQNQMLDYGFNFMNTKIYIDNESTICIVKNLVYHFKTKHIAIRHHFIRDAYEKKLIQVLKIYTDDNVADLLSSPLMLAVFSSWLGLLGFRELLRRVIDGIEALQLPTLFILWLDEVSTDSAKKHLKHNLHPSPDPTSDVPHEHNWTHSPAHTSEVPLEQQTDPSPRPSPNTTIPDSIPETSGGKLGGHSSSDKSLSGNEGDMTIQGIYDLCLSLCAQVTDQAKEIQHLKAQITKLKKQAKPVIKHHRMLKCLIEAKIPKQELLKET
ncbi:putative ribonuclease H-like domain-containing protein [Tanacetum coccineum]